MLKRVLHFKYLRVIFDQSLTCNEHVNKLQRKIASQLGILGKIRNNLTTAAADQIYKSMILPKLAYCDFVWNTTTCDQLERLQYRDAKIVLKDAKRSYEKVLTQLGWKLVSSRCTMHRIIFLFKCLNCNGFQL